MKRIISITMAFMCVLVLFAGCKKKEGAPALTTVPTTINIVNENEPVSSYDKETRTLKTTNYNPDGSIANITTITKNEAGLVEKECVYDSEEKLISSTHTKYDENANIKELSFFDGENKLMFMYGDYEYKQVKTEKSTKYLLLEYSRYDSENKKDTVYKYIYNDKNDCIAMESYSPDGKLLTKNTF